ncbi:MAG: prolyl oligopeptidase family serine peptidase, partial [Kangiellaceae bacterium]|nr:prolyl oligopeptidase family serine peptidase [Kangiellaceae bacterium]
PYTAIYVGAGISDWTIHYVHEYENVTTRDFSFAATPWQDPKIYRKSSPITYINNARTPTLIIHGDKDPIVHVSSAQLLYHGLKDRNIEVEYLEFENMGHWASQPKQKYALHWYAWAWLSRNLFTEEVKVPEKLQLKRYN